MRPTDVITRYPSIGVFLFFLLASLATGIVGIVFLVGAFRAVRPGVPRKDVMRALSWVRRSPLIDEVFAGAGAVHARRAVTWCRVQLALALGAALVFGYIAVLHF